MTDFYNDMASTATELLTEFGKQLFFWRKVSAEFDPIEGKYTEVQAQYFKTIGVELNINTDHVGGLLVEKGDKMLIIDASFEPKINDRYADGYTDADFGNVVLAQEIVVLNNVPLATWTITAIEQVKPANTAIVYKVLLRR